MFKTFTIAVLMAAVVGASGPSVKVKESHKAGFAPRTIRITVTIEPFEGNRKACMTIDGGEYSHSCWDVQGATHPRTEWFERRIGAGGEYFVNVTLASIVDGEVKYTTDTTQFVVEEPGVPFVR
jgi:hypothetical protein